MIAVKCAFLALVLHSCIAPCSFTPGKALNSKRVRFVVLGVDNGSDIKQIPFGKVIRSVLAKAGYRSINGTQSAHDLIIQVDPQISKMSFDPERLDLRFQPCSAEVTGRVLAIRDDLTIATADFHGTASSDGRGKFSGVRLQAEADACLQKAFRKSDFEAALIQILRKS